MEQEKPEKAQRGIQSVEVGGALLKALAEADTALPLTELARRAGLTAAKAHPYLVSYGSLGLIVQDRASGRYDFGPLALAMGIASFRRLNPLQIAISGLDALVASTGQTAAVAVWGNHGPTVVHIQESDRPLHVNLRPGSVMSLVNTATGQVFAAYLPEAKLAPALAREGLAGSPTVGAGLDPVEQRRKQAENVRAAGMGRTVNHPIPGISALSAPVFNDTGALALVITLLGPDGTFDAAPQGPLAAALKQHTAAITARLGGKPA